MSGLRFAPFVRSAGTDEFESSLSIDGRNVSVAVAGAGSDDPASVEQRATDAVLWTATNVAELVYFSAEHLLEDLNDDWVEGGRTVDISEYAQRLGLRRIHVARDGRVQVTFGDGGLFWGHDIVVHVDGDRQLRDVELEG